jgi:hypothetical protein
MHSEKAMEAYWKEWKNLESKQVWRWETVRERSEVIAEAKKLPVGQQEVHFGFLFGIMVEKGSEYPVGDERRYYKYRVVFQGNNVKDQNWDVAMFNELASQPATMEASRIADIYSCFKGNSLQGRDVEQAYLQADMEGPPVWIVLPRELWTTEMKGMRDPVVRLEKALYGHKHSGVYWQKFCKAQVENAGFVLVSENWPCVYFNYKTNMLLIVYVDDMKLAGPTEHMAETWAALGRNIKLAVPKGDKQDKENFEMTFLGCTIRRKTQKVNGKDVVCLEYDVEDSLRKCLSKYDEAVLQLTGRLPRYQNANTPFLEESTKECVYRAPLDTSASHFVECPSCRHTFSKDYSDSHCTFKMGHSRKVTDFQKEHRAREASSASAATSTATKGVSGSGVGADDGKVCTNSFGSRPHNKDNAEDSDGETRVPSESEFLNPQNDPDPD